MHDLSSSDQDRSRRTGIALAPLPKPPWEQVSLDGTILSSAADGPAQDGDEPSFRGVSSLDQGEFAAQFAAARRACPITDTQIAAVLDVLVQAGSADGQNAYLDPMAPPHERMLAFSRILRPAIERGEIPDVTLNDDVTLQQLYDAALSWGAEARRVMDDPDVTEIKLIGTGLLADSARGRIVVPDAYRTTKEPESRIEALAQTAGILWDGEHPSITIPLPHKTRLHAIHAPMLKPGDLLGVIRRGRRKPWTYADQVKRGALSEEGAALLHDLMQAFPSIIVSGAPDAGKTTFLECTVNSLPRDVFLVLIEDNTDELHLDTWLVTRLQVGSDVSLYRKAVRCVLRITPDIMIPCEIRGSEAGPVIEIAYAGRPTITTIHADTPHDALERAALLAAAEDGDSIFKGHPEWALRILTRTFHLIVHLEFSRLLYQRIVTSVHLLDGVHPDNTPKLIPLIEARLPATADGEPQWICHAQVHDGGLVWRDGQTATPARLARRLADVPTGVTRGIVRTTAATDQIEVLLADVRAALRHPDQGAYIVSGIEQAYRLNPDLHDIWQLAERAWSSHSGVKACLGARVEQAVTALQAALAARDLGAAHAAIDAAQESALLQTALQADSRWQAASELYQALKQLVQDLDDTLNAAHYFGAQQQDYARAFRLLERFDAHTLPAAQAKELWEARIYLLRKQLAAGTTQLPAAVTEQLRTAEQALAELNNAVQQARPATAARVDAAYEVPVALDQPPSPSHCTDSSRERAVGATGSAVPPEDQDDLAALLADAPADDRAVGLASASPAPAASAGFGNGRELVAPDTVSAPVAGGDLPSEDGPVEDQQDVLVDDTPPEEDIKLPIELSSSADVGNGLEGIVEPSVWDQWSKAREYGADR